jgi:hypothetical protein
VRNIVMDCLNADKLKPLRQPEVRKELALLTIYLFYSQLFEYKIWACVPSCMKMWELQTILVV